MTGVQTCALPISKAPGEPGWNVEYASDNVGLAVDRKFQLYKESLVKSNYKLEFAGQIESNSLGWVFRHQDSKNYYGMKLQVQPSGSRVPVKLIKWMVVNGQARNHTSVTLPFPVTAATHWKVKFEARQSRFTTTIQGQVVDVWEDTSIAKGGVGFVMDKGERAKIEAAEVAW